MIPNLDRNWLAALPQQFGLRSHPLSLQILGAALVVGLITGIIASGFKSIVNALLSWRSQLAEFVAPLPVLSWLIPALISGGMVALSFYLMRRFAPDTSGSGIPQIEGHLEGRLPMRWQRVLPIKFLGGILSLGAGLLAGFEGPTIQIGGSIGQMVIHWTKTSRENKRILIAVGAGA